jgi:hypothetical protein
MSRATVVRYTTRADAADDNERLIRAVFDQLAAAHPDGLRYVSLRLEDGVSFVHVAIVDADENPLVTLPAFNAFVSDIGERCVEGPAPANGTVIGAYRMGGDGTSAPLG